MTFVIRNIEHRPKPSLSMLAPDQGSAVPLFCSLAPIALARLKHSPWLFSAANLMSSASARTHKACSPKFSTALCPMDGASGSPLRFIERKMGRPSMGSACRRISQSPSLQRKTLPAAATLPLTKPWNSSLLKRNNQPICHIGNLKAIFRAHRLPQQVG